MQEATAKEKELDEKEDVEVVKGDEELDEKEEAAEREIERGYRIANFQGISYHIERLTVDIKDKAAFEKSKEFTKLLKDGSLMSLKQLQIKLEESGVWTKENSDDIDTKRDKYVAILQKVADENKKARPNRAKLADFNKKAEEVKIELLIAAAEKATAESHSIETYADKIETYAKLALCVYRVDEKDVRTKVWDAPLLGEAIELVRQEKDEVLFAHLNWQADSFWNGYSPDFLGDWQEAIGG